MVFLVWILEAKNERKIAACVLNISVINSENGELKFLCNMEIFGIRLSDENASEAYKEIMNKLKNNLKLLNKRNETC